MKRITALLLALVMLFTLSACGHKHSWRDATCTEAKTCADCGKTEGEPLGHDWGEPTYEWAEDFSSVTATRVCKHDASHVETETAAASAEVTAAASCEEPGETVYTASFANEAFTAQTHTEPLPPAAGHAWTGASYEWAEDFSSVTATRVCGNDPAHAETEIAEVTAEVTKAASCEEPGETTYTAVFGNPAFETQSRTEADPAPLGHDWGEPSYEWAEDFSSVTATRVCENDPEHVEVLTSAVTAEVVREPGCDEPGEVIYTAAGFDDVPVEVSAGADLDPVGHVWGEPTYEWAEDLSSVTATRICEHDASHVETETAAVSAEVKADPSCEGAGETTYTAVFENEAFAPQVRLEADLEPLGHDWGEPTYEWAEDLSSVTATRVCEHDPSHVETETAAVSAETTKAPACEEAGETVYTAAFAGEAFEAQTRTEELEPPGHDWQAATHTAPQTCSVCGATEGEALPIHYFDRSFKEYRSDFNHRYPGFLYIESRLNKGFLLRVKGETLNTNGLDGDLRLYHADEFYPGPVRSTKHLKDFNLIRIRYDSKSPQFDTSISGRVAQLGYYAAKVLDPGVNLDDFFKLGLDLFSAKDQTQSFTHNGFVYTLSCSQKNDAAYRYEFTITLEDNLE